VNKLKIREGWTKTNELRNKKVGSGQTGKGFSLFFFFFSLLWVFVAARGFSLVAASRGFSLVETRRLFVAVASLVTEHSL